MIGGDKGDGKSLFSMTLLDYLTNHEEDCLLVDSDVSNPDVYTTYSKEVPSAILDLSIPDGWVEFVNLCKNNWGKTIVVNGTANGIEVIEKYSKTLLNSLFTLQRHLVTFWVMSDDTNNLDTLARYKKVVGRRVIHVVNNEKYDHNRFRLSRSNQQRDGFTHTGRIAYLSNLSEETRESFIEEKITIKEFIDNPSSYCHLDGISHEILRSSSAIHEMSQWRRDFDGYIFKYLNYKIEDLISIGNKTSYRTFTRKLADKIEEELKHDYFNDVDYYLFYSPSDHQSDDWRSEDMGDLIAEGKVSIEDLAAAAATGEDLNEEDRIRLERSLEPETQEEYQERLQQEYVNGGSPDDFIPTAEDVRSRAANEYMDGGNPDNFIPTEFETQMRYMDKIPF
jgi:hypothetical protein